MVKIVSIINNIPHLLQYFLPGAWGLYIFLYFSNKKLDNNLFIIISCCLSYCQVNLHRLIFPRINLSFNVILSFIFSSVLAILLVHLFDLKSFQKAVSNFTHKTTNSSFWRDIWDLEKGANIKVYLKDKSFYITGYIHTIDEDDEDWIAVGGHTKWNISNDDHYRNTLGYEDDETVRIILRIKDIDYMEIIDGE